jgi:hypothetical protein
LDSRKTGTSRKMTIAALPAMEATQGLTWFPVMKFTDTTTTATITTVADATIEN